MSVNVVVFSYLHHVLITIFCQIVVQKFVKCF